MLAARTHSELLRFFAAIALSVVAIGCGSSSSEPPTDPAVRELRVVTSGGLAAAYDRLAPRFEQRSGVRLVTAYGSSSGGAPDSIPERLAAGEEIDVILLSRSSLDNLASLDEVRPETRVDLAHSKIGLAVQAGATHPDIGTVEAFLETIDEAESIGYSASASGTYLSTDLFPRLGVWEVIEPKSTRVLSERVAAVVARGEVEIGFQQVSEIVPIEGAEFVGPIPEALQKTTTFAAAVTARARNVDDARRLLEFLQSPEAAAVIEQTGLSPVASPDKDAYPSRPLTVVVGFGVGGSADRMARSVAPFLAKELGQPVRVINKKGAGTLLGANYVLGQSHDGYTLFASSFSPYLSNTILEGNADYTIDDFGYLNFQWFDEDLIAANRETEYESLPSLLEEIRDAPRTVKASVVRGSAGHLMAKLLLEVSGIPPASLNLVTYNSGGQARAAVAGGVVDFIVISAEGCESIREYVRPLAIVSDRPNLAWDAPPLNEALAPTGVIAPILPGSIRGFATTAECKDRHPDRFATLAAAVERTLQDEELRERLDGAGIGRRWTGPRVSQATMRETFDLFKSYSHLLRIVE